MITFFSATIVPLAVILFVVLVFVHALVSAQQVREAEQQWSLARAFGLFFDGEYPEISLRKGEVLFEQLVMPGAKGGVAYKHQFTAPTTQFAFELSSHFVFTPWRWYRPAFEQVLWASARTDELDQAALELVQNGFHIAVSDGTVTVWRSHVITPTEMQQAVTLVERLLTAIGKV